MLNIKKNCWEDFFSVYIQNFLPAGAVSTSKKSWLFQMISSCLASKIDARKWAILDVEFAFLKKPSNYGHIAILG